MADKLNVFWVGGIVMFLFIINLAAVELTGYPPAYCLGEKFLVPVVGPWLGLANLIVGAFFIIRLFERNLSGALVAFAMVILVYGMPDYADVLLRLDGKCLSQSDSPPAPSLAI